MQRSAACLQQHPRAPSAFRKTQLVAQMSTARPTRHVAGTLVALLYVLPSITFPFPSLRLFLPFPLYPFPYTSIHPLTPHTGIQLPLPIPRPHNVPLLLPHRPNLRQLAHVLRRLLQRLQQRFLTSLTMLPPNPTLLPQLQAHGNRLLRFRRR